jgi:hypothetical protein
MKLYPDQKRSIQKLSKVKVGAFFMEAGTGKTRPLVELVRILNPTFVLYISPLRTIKTRLYSESVKYQVDLWGGFNCDVRFVGVETISLSDKVYLELNQLLSNSINPVIVVDESLKIKNIDAKRTKRCIQLGNKCTYKFILNGTPLSKNLLDIYSQMEFLSPSILNMTFNQFKNTFCEYKQFSIRKPGSRVEVKKEWIIKYHNLDYLYRLIEPFIYEADLKLDVGLNFIDLRYNLSPNDKENHTRIMDKVLNDEWLRAKPNFFLHLTQKLQHNYSLSPEKISITKELLRLYPNTLVVAKFISTQNKLKELFPNARILSWQKHSFGLNLQEYNTMILFDQHWDYALFEQIIRRIYRSNQKNNCTIWRLIGDVGLERLMLENVDKKRNLLQAFKQLNLDQFKEKAA